MVYLKLIFIKVLFVTKLKIIKSNIQQLNELSSKSPNLKSQYITFHISLRLISILEQKNKLLIQY